MERKLIIFGLMFLTFGLSYGQSQLNNNTVLVEVENASLMFNEPVESEILPTVKCEENYTDQAHIFKNNTKKFIEWYLPFRIDLIKKMIMMA